MTEEAVSTNADLAYLVVRTGVTRGDVYRLPSNQVTTIGRATTCRIVVQDEICSRNHCELFFSSDRWRLRDCGSRNGTKVRGEPIVGDVELRFGQSFQIGSTIFGLAGSLSQRWDDDAGLDEPIESDTVDAMRERQESDSNPEILHRRRQSRFRQPVDSAARDKTSLELSRLYRLALDMGAATTAQSLAEIVLEGLLNATAASIGAILLTPVGNGKKSGSADQLTVVAYRAENHQPYHPVSAYLSQIVLTDQEAVLARDIASDARFLDRDSLGEIQAQSVICAPVRTQEKVHGLIHLYSTDAATQLEVDDLEFTLAVADQMAAGLEQLQRVEKLQAGLQRAEVENQTLREQLRSEMDLIGESTAMQQLKGRIARIAPTDATALIRGESGSGKELIARAIHIHSNRRNGPFITMNCAALSESLLESELFGHEKGSFTGAVGRKLGKFEQAHHGTIFLDEVGEMSPGVQAKFLRVLEGHPFERVGGGEPVHADVRVVAATNRDLEKAVADGTFRQDLYFRLQVVELVVEPLRRRRSDIPLLANYFLNRFARKMARNMVGFTPGAMQSLIEYDWPGNVRELQHTIERAVILCPHEAVGQADLHLSALGSMAKTAEPSRDISTRQTFEALPLEIVEQQHILATLEWTSWNKSQAAQILGIERSTLDRKLKRYDVERPKEKNL
ncbi:MAG: sigma-54-dependent Fis family transcriptional regulator [Planctomyces sp.]|jgi:Nif-specific regulatory protein|nr:sigma-54-dependent Fis family transcriptional regulator [Planctomyces sp.]